MALYDVTITFAEALPFKSESRMVEASSVDEARQKAVSDYHESLKTFNDTPQAIIGVGTQRIN